MPQMMPFMGLLICLVAACAALPEGGPPGLGPPHDLTAAERAQIEGAQIEREEIDRFFDALILGTLATEGTGITPDMVPEGITPDMVPEGITPEGITPDMMRELPGTAIQIYEMQRLIEQMHHPAIPYPMVPR